MTSGSNPRLIAAFHPACAAAASRTDAKTRESIGRASREAAEHASPPERERRQARQTRQNRDIPARRLVLTMAVRKDGARMFTTSRLIVIALGAALNCAIGT